MRHGTLDYFSPNTVSRKPRYFFLFSDSLLLTKRTGPQKFWLKIYIHLGPNVHVIPMWDSPDFEFRLLIDEKGTLAKRKQRRLILYGQNKGHKEAWLSDLLHCLWDSTGRKGPDPSIREKKEVKTVTKKENEADKWSCSNCTYLNKPGSSHCDMCGGAKFGGDVDEYSDEEEERRKRKERKETSSKKKKEEEEEYHDNSNPLLLFDPFSNNKAPDTGFDPNQHKGIDQYGQAVPKGVMLETDSNPYGGTNPYGAPYGAGGVGAATVGVGGTPYGVGGTSGSFGAPYGSGGSAYGASGGYGYGAYGSGGSALGSAGGSSFGDVSQSGPGMAYGMNPATAGHASAYVGGSASPYPVGGVSPQGFGADPNSAGFYDAARNASSALGGMFGTAALGPSGGTTSPTPSGGLPVSTPPGSGGGSSPYESNLDDVAQKELLEATRAIEQLAAQLASRPRKAAPRPPGSEHAEITTEEVSDAIMDGAQAIAKAATALMRAASLAQEERVKHNTQHSTPGKPYHTDPLWANGLISAARGVVATTQHLVSTSNSAASGQAGEETLVASARAVGVSTAQLVAAQKAKGDVNSQASKELDDAARGIARATAMLVEAAKLAQTPVPASPVQQPAVPDKYSMTDKQIREIEAQTRLLQLEKETQRAREELLQMRKKEYQS